MTYKPDINRVTLASIVIAFLGACSPLEGGSAKESSNFDQWVTKYVNPDEKLLCKREENGEYFFLAREVTGDRVKVGSRLDLSLYRQTHAFIVAWKFRNKKGGPLVTNVPPSAVKEEYVKSDGKTYAENVQYQTLYLKDSEEMHVTIDIKKCPTADCERQQTKSRDEKEYSIKLCEVPLKP